MTIHMDGSCDNWRYLLLEHDEELRIEDAAGLLCDSLIFDHGSLTPAAVAEQILKSKSFLSKYRGIVVVSTSEAWTVFTFKKEMVLKISLEQKVWEQCSEDSVRLCDMKTVGEV